jgi:hypothetical protein
MRQQRRHDLGTTRAERRRWEADVWAPVDILIKNEIKF